MTVSHVNCFFLLVTASRVLALCEKPLLGFDMSPEADFQWRCGPIA